MCEFDTEQKLEHERNLSEREKQCRYWGFKFEQYLCVRMYIRSLLSYVLENMYMLN